MIENIKFDFAEMLITTINFNEKIDYVKILVRKSREYSRWVKYVHDSVSFLQLPEFEQNDIKNIDVTTEVHHIVFLDSIIGMVACKHFYDNPSDTLTAHQLADMVINMHLADMIPCIILPKTAHELYHCGKYDLKKNLSGLHKGEYIAFLEYFDEYLTDQEKDILAELGMVTDEK